MAEQVALVLVAAELAQVGLLCGGFHAFGNHCQLQAVTQGDDGAHNGLAVGAGVEVAHKRLIDFYFVQRQALQVAQ